ncbi:MAG: hypothetical protein CHACPFDD_01072 [Phycisphaerae bacterium]|nr:hypothetical protein [Phycisphaerae bacterium]
MLAQTILAIALLVAGAAPSALSWDEVTVLDQLPAEARNAHYPGNRAPLRPVPLTRLPVGAITPGGWLQRQLRLQADGFIGRLGEISHFLRQEGNAWLAPDGEGHSNWEELPYWLKGFGDMAYLLGDEKLIAEARVWIEGALGSQRGDGYFGPRANLTAIQTDAGKKPDLWPNMVMLNALQSYYEWTAAAGRADERVIALMERYFRWELEYPEADFLLPFWQQQRAADNLASVYWLYNRTGEAWLLELATKIHRRTANWTDGVANWHGVNISQSFRGPAVYWQQSGDARQRSAPYRNYDEVMRAYGQVPGGMFGADENCRKGFGDPRQAAESCTMVEFMYSFEQLLAVIGDPLWADRCEQVAFNSLPAAMTADFRGLRYLTAPNMISSDARSKAPGYENAGPMQLFDPRDHRCCQHNVAHGWPYFCEHLWMATADNGLAAVLYAPCEVRARAGDDGAAVTLHVETKYPFRDDVEVTIRAAEAVTFPLHVRIPAWAQRTVLTVNGADATPRDGQVAGKFVRIQRAWRDGDRLRLVFERSLRTVDWPANRGSVSIAWGPLEFALDLKERVTTVRPDDAWPAFELHAQRAWNCGLDLNDLAHLSTKFRIVPRDWPRDDQPFTPESTPVELVGPVRAMAGWGEDHLGLVGLLQDCPARATGPAETARLIPMGCARLRIAQFPTVSDGLQAHAWTPPAKPKDAIPASASACWREDTLTALSDGLEPRDSGDFNIPRFTWWPQRGTREWVQYDFDGPRRVARVAVYWFDDSGRGRCRPPASWRLLYKPIGAGGGEEWREVRRAPEAAYGVEINRYNEVAFEPVETTALRIEAQLRPDFCAGLLEWRAE